MSRIGLVKHKRQGKRKRSVGKEGEGRKRKVVKKQKKKRKKKEKNVFSCTRDILTNKNKI